MFMTAQKKLEFQPEDQSAMDGRIRYDMFKSLPSAKKKAAPKASNGMYCLGGIENSGSQR